MKYQGMAVVTSGASPPYRMYTHAGTLEEAASLLLAKLAQASKVTPDFEVLRLEVKPDLLHPRWPYA